MSEDLREYSRLLERVLARFRGLSREELEAMVEAKLRESKLLNRVGALLLVAEELGAFKEREDVGEIKSYAKIGGLVPGLRDVSIRGVVYAMAGPVEAGGHKILRLKMGDETGSVNVIIWDEKVEEVNDLGLKLGDQIAVLHGYTRERLRRVGRSFMSAPAALSRSSARVSEILEASISISGRLLKPGMEYTM